ncbi:MAG TPA: thioesterase family protein [Pyrinomonadaceae bacterium]|nr:thioesterase family protein [Pyrinomonadaceae bacterium]HMP66892.1 thioesterase family protein [Pyrinomonadaceae bacterium]
MSEIFEKTFHVGWADVDLNGHLRNTAYIDLAVDVRLFYFEANGFPVSEFNRQRFGPVMMRDEIDYRREVQLLETIRVNLLLDGVSQDVSRFRLRQDIVKSDGSLAAKLVSTGGWLSFDTRKLIVPPPQVAEMWSNLTRTEDFEELPSSIKS